ncbi:homoserine dehydrogenase [Scopulibacillus darangshiensis]|uniref:Homoserine dehydrogenase n=1 Tax=Scopulibacillus darangshiensis TaxID=442528 RepID=A0A4R2NP48_9BACL|nr:homoserine dehydrogenase [Scopulibacillus darangshiensis]TCP23507.1 homoserine dehydrogenase [Scopulibacillus darangshiensis]
MTINVALLGFGTVGQGVYETVQTHQHELSQKIGEEIRIVSILIKSQDKDRRIEENVQVTTSFADIFKQNRIDIVIEAIVGCDPTYNYVKEVLSQAIPVVTANKELMAKKGSHLRKVARENKTTIAFEASVAGGIPIIRVINECLQINRIEKVEAILNGTSNYILSSMRENGLSFKTALADAQKLGYAEADPANDILGWDAFYKTMILSDLIYGSQPDWEQAYRKGIDNVTEKEIKAAENEGKKVKLIATLSKAGGRVVHAEVKPVKIGPDHPLYSVEGVDNAVSIQTDLAENLVFQGPGAGALPTASSILQDVIKAALRNRSVDSKVAQVL